MFHLDLAGVNMNAADIFIETKEKVLKAIHSHQHITTDSSFTACGIYMLYVDDFSSNRIIPIYIGQTTDFRKRLKQHLTDLEEINTTHSAEHHLALLRGAVGLRCPYEGRYKACKIFKYMVDHGCKMCSLRMIVLKECEKSQLHDLEQHYLSEFLSAYFGFNQINSITEFWVKQVDSEKYTDYVRTDAELFRKFIGYGFTVFNYLHAFRGFSQNTHKEFIEEQIDVLYGKALLDTPSSELISIHAELHDEYVRVFDAAKPQIVNSFSDSVHAIFTQCKLKSKGREDEVLSVFLNPVNSSVARETRQPREYLEYYMNRNKNSKKCGELLTELYTANHAKISAINTPVISAFEAYEDFKHNTLAKSKFAFLFPSVPYLCCPLDAE